MTRSRPDDFETEEPIHSRPQGSADSARVSESDPYLPRSVELSEPLESMVSLETPRMNYISAPNLPAVVPAVDERSQSIPQPVSPPIAPTPLANQPHDIVIPLLEERLVVDRRRQKVGEIVVRKEIETHIVEVPIRREKLIVEQVSPEYEQLAVLDLGQTPAQEINPFDGLLPPTVSANFTSTNAAIQFLQAIATESNSAQKLQVRVVLEDAAVQATYQRWADQYSANTP